MQAIILAAGRGSRLKAHTEAIPKGLVPLRGQPLIAHQITALRNAGIDQITIVTGYLSDAFETYGDDKRHNPRWADTNMVQSLRYASDILRSHTCIISYADIFYSPDTVRALKADGGPCAISYDPNWLDTWSARFSDPLTDAESFTLDSAGRLIEIGQTVRDISAVHGQYMGLLKFTPDFWVRAETFFDNQDTAKLDGLDMTSFLNTMLKNNVPINTVKVVGDWGEIDTPEDLDLYNRRGYK